jgi:uncharacterized protein YggE
VRWIYGSVVVLSFLAVPGAGFAQDTPPPHLTVQGVAEVRVAPDLAVVRLGVAQQAPTADEAQQQVNRVAGEILAAVGREGVGETDIQTSRLMLSPIDARQIPGNSQPPQIVAYRASNTVSIRVGDLDRVGSVMDAALAAGANQLEGVSFLLLDDLPARQEALRAAVVEARAKAGVMAEALGVELGPIHSVGEGGVSVQPPIMETAGAVRAMALQAGNATPVSPGELTGSAAVTISYGIVQSGSQPE